MIGSHSYLFALAALLYLPVSATAQTPPNIYPTYGAHNDPGFSDCAKNAHACVYTRAPGEPTDPELPEYWTSHWIMYRVFGQFEHYPPPFAGRPPAPLKDGVDYETSHGATFYDSTTHWPNGKGAIMEYYDKRCLPIFPGSNHYSCAFVSLGDTAYFVTYDDRPDDMPQFCLFSPHNHPPARNFISHLPYSVGDSERLGKSVQGYSFWTSENGPPFQVGAFPVQSKQGILFGYAFEALARPDAANPAAPPYRHPQSFYFSGAYDYDAPMKKPQAPIVSQNYTDFAMIRPDPEKTWNQVKDLDLSKLPDCHLFDRQPKDEAAALTAGRAGRTGMRSWAPIGGRR